MSLYTLRLCVCLSSGVYSIYFLCVCLDSSPHLQHVADVEDGAVLSGVHVRGDVAVFVLDGHTPACELHHLSPLLPVEVKQLGLLHGSLAGGAG